MKENARNNSGAKALLSSIATLALSDEGLLRLLLTFKAFFSKGKRGTTSLFLLAQTTKTFSLGA
ncbi:MAG: hypothetical protein R3E61_07895 [Pseudomonadales bacterium]